MDHRCRGPQNDFGDQTVRSGEEDVPWLSAGHSMGGKLAACVARAAVDGRAGLANLAGIILISPSPPGPEPMEESKRQTCSARLEREGVPSKTFPALKVLLMTTPGTFH
jgi:pimeloyl-ACP methyl ester carboxylesterase